MIKQKRGFIFTLAISVFLVLLLILGGMYFYIKSQDQIQITTGNIVFTIDYAGAVEEVEQKATEQNITLSERIDKATETIGETADKIDSVKNFAKGLSS